MTELLGLAWVCNAYIVASREGWNQWQYPNCLVLGQVRFTLELGSEVESWL